MKVEMNDSWNGKKYVYLDWNVFKYMIKPRQEYAELEKPANKKSRGK